MSPKSSWWRRKGGTEASDKPQEPQQLCEDGALQNGRLPYSPRLDSEDGLDGEIGPERCIPSGTNSQGTSMSPPVPVGIQDLPICVPLIRADISTPSIHKDYETSGGDASANGNSSDYISGRHLNYAPFEGRADTVHSLSMSVCPGPGTDSQPGEISTHPQTGDRVPGIPCELSLLPLSLPIREDEEDPAGCSNSRTTPISFNKRLGQICGEGVSLDKGHLACPCITGSTDYDKFGEWVRQLLGEQSIQVQCQPPAHYTSHEGLALVDSPGQRLPDGLNPVTSNPRLDN